MSFSDAVLAAVKSAWPLTGDARVPDGLAYDTDGHLVQPYAVVYPGGGGGGYDGSLRADDLDSDSFPVSQVTYVGATREQAEQLRSKVRPALLGKVLTLSADHTAGPVRLDLEQPLRRDDDVTPHLFYVVDLYRAFTTSS